MLLCLIFALSFAAGGFHGYTAAAWAIAMAILLIGRVSRAGGLTLRCNFPAAALLAVVVCSCLSPLWAADRGMAPFGILRWIPAGLFGLYLMQCTQDERSRVLDAVPVCGAAMTVLSALLLLIPGMEGAVTVNGRLGGFFQYPNTFAAFLLAGLILQNARPAKPLPNFFLNGALLCGIILSGSRTVFLLLLITLAALLYLNRATRLSLVAGFAAALILGLAASRLGWLEQADRYTSLSPTAGTFLVRLLYYKDALGLIAAHPAGLGYLGYRALEGSIQTGRYYVTFVHSGLLQLLLDWGWVPGGLLAAAYLRRLCSRSICAHHRLALAMLLGHCLLDYDTEFLVIRILLLSLLDFGSGKEIVLPFRRCICAIAACCAAVCLWLGAGELCYYTGRTDLCLSLTPFHTDAMAYELSRSEEPLAAEPLADKILAANPRHTLAWNAKANAAFVQGDMDTMWRCKQNAFRSDRYAVKEYCDGINKLYTAAQLFLGKGNAGEAERCIRRILEIPGLLKAVENSTDPLAWRTGDDPSMTLPEDYRLLIEYLSEAQ